MNLFLLVKVIDKYMLGKREVIEFITKCGKFLNEFSIKSQFTILNIRIQIYYRVLFDAVADSGHLVGNGAIYN